MKEHCLSEPPRPTTSQGSSSTNSSLKHLTLRPSHSNPSLSPIKLAPALRLQKSSETSELWAPTVDAEGAYIRRTYAYFEQQGVTGDGWEEGREWTRERGASSPWEAASSRLGSRQSLHHSHSSMLSASFKPSPLGSNAIESLLQVPPNALPIATRPSSVLSVTQSEESLLSAPTHTPASLRTPATSTLPEKEKEEDAAAAAAEQGRVAKESILLSIDRYGFFSRTSSAPDRCPRTTVLPSEPLSKLPSKSSLSAGARPLSSFRRGTIGGQDSSSSTDRVSSRAQSRFGSRQELPQASPTLSDMGSSSSATSAVLEAAHAKRASGEAAQRQREAARTEKWQRMLRVDERDAGQNVRAYAFVAADGGAGSRKLRRRVYKGVPDRWRAAAWWALLQAQPRSQDAKVARAQLEQAEQNYAQLVQTAGPHDVQIDLDVPRTISGHVLFHTRYGQGQRSLFHVLHAFSLHCSQDCAYCQGMGPIAATLLVYMPPERAYACLVALHDDPKYNIHKTFSPGFPGLVESFYVQEQLTRSIMPDLAASFETQGISTSSYATKWYITLFAHVVPFATQVRLWDALLLEGADALIAMSLAILWALRLRLTSPGAGFEVLLGALSAEFLPEDDDVLMRWVGQLLARDDVRKVMRTARTRWSELEASGEAMNHIT